MDAARWGSSPAVNVLTDSRFLPGGRSRGVFFPCRLCAFYLVRGRRRRGCDLRL